MFFICNKQMSDTTLPCIQSPVEKCNPYPSQKQEEKHEWESEGKPRAKVDEVAVWKVAVNQKFCFQTAIKWPDLCLNAAQNKKSPFQLSNQDEVGRSASECSSSSDTRCVRNTDQESFPHLQLILGLWSDLLSCPQVCLLRHIRPYEVIRDLLLL